MFEEQNKKKTLEILKKQKSITKYLVLIRD